MSLRLANDNAGSNCFDGRLLGFAIRADIANSNSRRTSMATDNIVSTALVYDSSSYTVGAIGIGME